MDYKIISNNFLVPTFFRHLGFLQRYTFGIISLSDYATGQPTCNSNTWNPIQTKSICFIFSDEQKNTLEVVQKVILFLIIRRFQPTITQSYCLCLKIVNYSKNWNTSNGWKNSALFHLSVSFSHFLPSS